jgi:hypothetical protein
MTSPCPPPAVARFDFNSGDLTPRKGVIPAKEAVSQLSDGPMIFFVIPGVILNPLSF